MCECVCNYCTAATYDCDMSLSTVLCLSDALDKYGIIFRWNCLLKIRTVGDHDDLELRSLVLHQFDRWFWYVEKIELSVNRQKKMWVRPSAHSPFSVF